MPRQSAAPDPISIEERDVEAARQLYQLVANGSREFGLLIRGINYEKLTNSASPPGAMTPEGARETLTRVALRRKADRQKAARSGHRGFLAAIRAA